MAVKLRLQRKGRKKAPYYHIVAADARSPRDGKYIERLGFYNPLTIPATIDINSDAAFKWIMNGAEPTDTVTAILRFKGVMYRKHLALGVAKGALTQEDADKKFATWMESKESKVQARIDKTKQEAVTRKKMISGVAKPKPVIEAEAPVSAEPIKATEEVVEAVAAVETVVADTIDNVAVEAPVMAETTESNEAAETIEAAVVNEVAEATEDAPAVTDNASDSEGESTEEKA